MKTELTYSEIALIKIKLRGSMMHYKKEAAKKENSERARAYCAEMLEDITDIVEKLKTMQKEMLNG